MAEQRKEETEMNKTLSLLLALGLLVSLFDGLCVSALIDGSDTVLALYVQNERKDAELENHARRKTLKNAENPPEIYVSDGSMERSVNFDTMLPCVTFWRMVTFR